MDFLVLISEPLTAKLKPQDDDCTLQHVLHLLISFLMQLVMILKWLFSEALFLCLSSYFLTPEKAFLLVLSQAKANLAAVMLLTCKTFVDCEEWNHCHLVVLNTIAQYSLHPAYKERLREGHLGIWWYRWGLKSEQKRLLLLALLTASLYTI